MRKIIPLFLVIAILCAGCSQEKTAISEPNQKGTNLISEEHIEVINLAVKSSLDAYDHKLYVEEKEGHVDIKVHMTGGMSKWIFADCVYTATDSARKAISDCGEELGTLSIIFLVESSSGENAIKWESEDFNTGLLIDSETQFTKNITLEEMIEKYEYEPIA